MRGLLLSIASFALVSSLGFAEDHTGNSKSGRPYADASSLGKKHVLCDDGATAENAWLDLVQNKLARHSSVGTNATTIDFGGAKITQLDLVSGVLKKAYSSELELPRVTITKPFRIHSKPIIFQRSQHFVACVIISEEFNEEEMKQPLGEKYALCDDGGSEENAIRDLFNNKLRGDVAVSRPIDFGMLSLSSAKELSSTIEDQIWNREPGAPYVRVYHPMQLHSLPITFKTKSGTWHACMIVSDAMTNVQVVDDKPKTSGRKFPRIEDTIQRFNDRDGKMRPGESQFDYGMRRFDYFYNNRPR